MLSAILLCTATAAVENGEHVAGLLVSRRDWSAAEFGDSERGSDERLSAMASSAPDAAAVRASGLLIEEGGSPDGGATPVRARQAMAGALSHGNIYDLPLED